MRFADFYKDDQEQITEAFEIARRDGSFVAIKAAFALMFMLGQDYYDMGCGRGFHRFPREQDK